MISFHGRHFPKDLILMAVRYPLSYRNIEELMDERGADVDHSMVQKWVVHYSPQLDQSFRKRKKPVGGSWRMDETYIKVNAKYTLGFKSFEAAEATISGIELYRMLRKGQLQNAGDMPAWNQFYDLAA